MKNYEIGYYSHEESARIMLIHELEYSEQEFQNLCAEITAELYLNRRTLFPESYEFEQDNLDALTDYDPKGKFEYLLTDVVDILINKHGFKKLEVQASFTPFGWANFIPKDDWTGNGGDDTDLTAIRNLIP